MTSSCKKNLFLSSPYPVRKKKIRSKCAVLKQESLDLSVAMEIDAFVADVIRKASQDYLQECKINGLQDPKLVDCNQYDQENNTQDASNADDCFKYKNVLDNRGIKELTSRLHNLTNNNTEDVSKEEEELRCVDATNPLIEQGGKEKKRKNTLTALRRVIQRFTCCNSDCFKNVYELT